MKTIIARAVQIQKTLGTRVAAGYLRNQGVCISAALDILLRPVTRTYYINEEV